MRRICCGLVVAFILLSCTKATAQRMSLNGKWRVRLDSFDHREYLINLPGTLDDAGIGIPNSIQPALNLSTLAHLTRKHQYTGKAYYTRTFMVPADWKSKRVRLVLGRVLWKSTIRINGKQLAETGESLSVSQEFDVTGYLVPGKQQTITICIDNSNYYPGINIYATQYPSFESREMAHAYSNHTQVKWNGILGNIELLATPKLSLDKVDVYPDLQNRRLEIHHHLNGAAGKYTRLRSYVKDPRNGKQWPFAFVRDSTMLQEIAGTIPIADDAALWSEFTPRLYQLVTILQSDHGTDTMVTSFGLRELKRTNGDLYLNNQRIFLRGNLECVIFPLTGYPPMKEQEWLALLRKAKSYGLNMFRFHSWCPPQAAFAAADELGFYLQVELPHWSLKVGEDTASFRFLQREAVRILEAYGNHPSFLFFSMGNELEGNFQMLNDLVQELRQKDNRHLYSTTSFTFQQGLSGVPQQQDDFFITQWTKKGWVRGQGVFNELPPDFSKDFRHSLEELTVPVISHEIGQYSVYPDLKEISDYTGNLAPLNFIAVENDLRKKGMLPLAPRFLQASGKFASILYKEEIERTLRTKGLDGFHLLQLQDFPGQGTALVGMLNAFWKSKGFLTAAEFRQYCSEVTPLLRFPKAVYRNDETFVAEVELANFYRPMHAALNWEIRDDKKNLIGAGSFATRDYGIDNSQPVGNITVDLGKVPTARKLVVTVAVKGTAYRNEWNIWVYPSALKPEQGNVLVTSSFQEAMEALDAGRDVLLCPLPNALNGIEGKFVPVFWSPVHFRDQPGTMGLSIRSGHSALADFPTESHSNWQWWDLAIRSKALVADGLPDEAIIVRPIDNFMRNANLATLFEARVSRGRLIFCSMDLVSDPDLRLQSRQLKYSLLRYMNSAAFNPAIKLEAADVQKHFK